MFSVGTLVRFNWWSSYRAASATADDTGHVTWHEIHPGDKGVVLCMEASVERLRTAQDVECWGMKEEEAIYASQAREWW